MSRGLEIWLETSYGNPAYPGGGGRTLAGGFPTSEEGLQAWDAWVEKMATRYQGKVRDWSVWNEPELRSANKPELIIDFNIRTAEIIKRIIPEARIAALSVSSPAKEIVEPFVKTLAERNKADLFTWVVYHHYVRNPDEKYEAVDAAREIVREHTPNLRLWQGEAGTQSEWCSAGR